MEGRIIKGVGGIYTVLDLEKNEYVTCGVRGKLRYTVVDSNSTFNKRITSKTKLETKVIKISPKVGDYVTYSVLDDKYTIDEIKPRKNDLVRPSIANVDQVILIFASKKPDFNDLLLDQFLVLMEEANVEVTIVISKVDLLEAEELKKLKEEMAYYESIGYPVFFVNSKLREGFDELEKRFEGKITVLSGQTGAGKSKFINALIPGFELKTQEISEALGRGKHTTTASELYEFGGGFIGDTPGFSSLEFNLMEAEDLKEYFIEFPLDGCKYRGCNHDKEPNCIVKKMVEEGKILSSRYQNYLYFYNKIKNTVKKY